MITRSFDYLTPTTIESALAALAQHRDKARLLAGGQSLIPLMKLGLATPDVVIDIKHITPLSYIRRGGDAVSIGALTKHSEIGDSSELRTYCPMLPAAARTIGHPLIRSRGTIGGSLAHSDPRSDYLLVLTALEADIIARSVHGHRSIPARMFLRGPFQNSLETDELICEIVITRERVLPTEIFAKFELGHGDFGLAAIAVTLWKHGSRIEKARVWVSGLADLPTRLEDLEQSLLTCHNLPEVTDAINRSVSKHESFSDFQASANFRKRVIASLLKRLVKTAVES